MCFTTVSGRRAVVLEHVLDEVDAAARAVELVAQEHISGASRGAEAAMDAGAEDLVGFADVGIGELGEGEMGLHGFRSHVGIHPAAVQDALGIEASLTRRVSAASAAGCGSKTGMAARSASGARNKVAWPPL